MLRASRFVSCFLKNLPKPLVHNEWGLKFTSIAVRFLIGVMLEVEVAGSNDGVNQDTGDRFLYVYKPKSAR
jgi:hypothetical protein